MGLGLGGFIDGIVLHKVLQWHHLLTGSGGEPADTVAGLAGGLLLAKDPRPRPSPSLSRPS